MSQPRLGGMTLWGWNPSLWVLPSMWGPATTLILRYSAGPGPSALESGALEQVEQRHGGLTDIHVSWVNVPFRHSRALERYASENWKGGWTELGKQEEVLCCLLCFACKLGSRFDVSGGGSSQIFWWSSTILNYKSSAFKNIEHRMAPFGVAQCISFFNVAAAEKFGWF